MARISGYENLKPLVKKLYEQGFKVSQVRKEYPDIPKTTLYDWFREFRNWGDRRAEPVDAPTFVIPESPTKDDAARGAIEYLCPADCDTPQQEIKVVKRELWKNIRNPTPISAIAIQGLNAYLRSIQIEHSLPAEDDSDTLTHTQRAERVAAILDKARNRRTG
ncbi:MAG: hypothetical protein AAGA75_09135 [Cyanobacteria bacterium P01_E01_bin.6]